MKKINTLSFCDKINETLKQSNSYVVLKPSIHLDGVIELHYKEDEFVDSVESHPKMNDDFWFYISNEVNKEMIGVPCKIMVDRTGSFFWATLYMEQVFEN